jgi:hypothetical protein
MRRSNTTQGAPGTSTPVPRAPLGAPRTNRRAKRDPDVFTTDFKCGVDKNGDALRWSYSEVIAGKKNGILFIDALKQKELVKLDTIFIIDNKINEITDSYLFRDSLPSPLEIKQSLRDEIEAKQREGNEEHLHVLRRCFL